MKLARIIDNVVVEIFEKENIEKKFHPLFISQLTEVANSTKLGDYFINGKKVPKKPSEFHQFIDNEWVEVLPPEEIRQRDKQVLKEELKTLLDTDAVTANKELIKKIIRLVVE
jgi:hypothetical protein